MRRKTTDETGDGRREDEGSSPHMPVQNRALCRLRTTAGSGPRLWRGAWGLRRARPRERGRAPSAVPRPPFGRQARPRPIRPSPPPSTGAPAATDRLLRQLSASASSAYIEYACGAAASAFSLGVRPPGGSRRVARRAGADSRRPEEGVQGGTPRRADKEDARSGGNPEGRRALGGPLRSGSSKGVHPSFLAAPRGPSQGASVAPEIPGGRTRGPIGAGTGLPPLRSGRQTHQWEPKLFWTAIGEDAS